MIANIVKVELLYLVVTVSASALRDLKRPHTRLQLARLEALERLGNVRHAPRSSHDADEVRRSPAKALRQPQLLPSGERRVAILQVDELRDVLLRDAADVVVRVQTLPHSLQSVERAQDVGQRARVAERAIARDGLTMVAFEPSRAA